MIIAKSYFCEKKGGVAKRSKGLVLSPFDYSVFIENRTVESSERSDNLLALKMTTKSAKDIVCWEELEISGSKDEISQIQLKIMIHKNT